MKYTWKKIAALSLIACMLGISTAGCGSAPAAEAGTKMEAPEPITGEIDAVKETDTKETDTPEPTADEADTEETDNPVPTDDQTNAKYPAPDSSDSSAEKQPPAEDNPDDSTETQDSGKWKVYDPDVAAAVDADFEGDVYKIEADSFFITPTKTILEEDGALISTSLNPGVEIPDEELVRVTFDDNTVFTLRDIYDGGERHEDSDASFQNIEKGGSVALKGKFQNDVFCADQIRIINVH